MLYYDIKESGKRIKELRKQKGLTQEQLADELNISYSMVGKIEIGYTGISIDLLIQMMELFEVSMMCFKRYMDASNHECGCSNPKFYIPNLTPADVTDRLMQINPVFAKQVRKVLDVNKSKRHIRGEFATKEKYQHRLAIISKEEERDQYRFLKSLKKKERALGNGIFICQKLKYIKMQKIKD